MRASDDFRSSVVSAREKISEVAPNNQRNTPSLIRQLPATTGRIDRSLSRSGAIARRAVVATTDARLPANKVIHRRRNRSLNRDPVRHRLAWQSRRELQKQFHEGNPSVDTCVRMRNDARIDYRRCDRYQYRKTPSAARARSLFNFSLPYLMLMDG